MTTSDAPRLTEDALRLLLVGPLDEAGAPIDAQHLEQVEAAWGRRGEHVASMWRTHERWLRDAARQRGILPRWAGRFFAEAVHAARRTRKD
jgi:hypothetical protein